MKRFLKGLLYTLLYLIGGFIALGVSATYLSVKLFMVVFGCVLLLPLIALSIKVFKRDWKTKTPAQKAEVKRTFTILGITLLVLAIVIPLAIFVIYPLFDYIITEVTDFIFFWHFGPFLAPLD